MCIEHHLSGFQGQQRGIGASAVRRWRWALLGVLAAGWLIGGAGNLWAQAESSGSKSATSDKHKARSRMLEHYRARLEVADDGEWRVIQERIESILRAEHDLQVAVAAGRHKSHSSKSSAGRAVSSGHSKHSLSFDGAEDIQALQQLVQEKAPAKEIKPRLAQVREVLKAREERLANAREELRAVLSSRQEAIAVLSGLLR